MKLSKRLIYSDLKADGQTLVANIRYVQRNCGPVVQAWIWGASTRETVLVLENVNGLKAIVRTMQLYGFFQPA